MEFVDNRHLSYEPKVATYIDVVATRGGPAAAES